MQCWPTQQFSYDCHWVEINKYLSIYLLNFSAIDSYLSPLATLPFLNNNKSLTRISRIKSTSWSSVHSIVLKAKKHKSAICPMIEKKLKLIKMCMKIFSVWMSSKDSIATLACHQRLAPTSFAQNCKKWKYLCFSSMSENTICTTWKEILVKR